MGSSPHNPSHLYSYMYIMYKIHVYNSNMVMAPHLTVKKLHVVDQAFMPLVNDGFVLQSKKSRESHTMADTGFYVLTSD